ncbi:hypothetical protein [Mycobacteroides chelonae]|jgi:hypothetical protein
MNRMLRRNVLALLVIALLTPAYLFWVIQARYAEYAKVRHPDPDIVVAHHQSATLHGVIWSVKGILRENKSRSYSDRNKPLPQGTEILRVGFERTVVPGQQPPSPQACTPTLISGATRWSRQTNGYSVTIDGTTTELDSVTVGPEGTNGTCQEDGVFQSGFLVPKGTRPDAIDVHILWGKSDSQTVRFQLVG